MSAALSLADLACALNGRIEDDHVRAPGPGHSTKDDGLIVYPDADDPDGFKCHSHHNEDFRTVRDYVKDRLGLAPRFTPRTAASTAPASARKLVRFNDYGLTSKGYKFVTAYDYQDDRGQLLYQVRRYGHPTEGKKFLQCRPDEAGGWLLGAGDTKVPYRWPDLVKAPVDAPVFVTEGEKDADRVASLVGLVIDRDGTF